MEEKGARMVNLDKKIYFAKKTIFEELANFLKNEKGETVYQLLVYVETCELIF